ncbi:MAG: DUF6033 family protein [Lachnospiraceae bacterium]|nr:DUF6033 family protein [Lachnospiraceae bacterium]
MSNISFDPYQGVPGRVQSDRKPGIDHKQQEVKTEGSYWSKEAGSVSFSQERYLRADAYGRQGQAVTNGTYEDESAKAGRYADEAAKAGRYADETAKAGHYADEAAKAGRYADEAVKYEYYSPESVNDALKKAWNSFRPSITDHADYGRVIGEVSLSETAASYYKELKSKFGNLDFVLVGKDSLAAAKSNAASYGNANKMVVLIDEEKLERMATDENFRKKYETLISQAQSKGSELSQIAAQNPYIKKIGMKDNGDGTTSFMAACAKGNAEASERVARRRAERKAEKKASEAKAEKKHAKEVREEKIESKRAQERAKRDEFIEESRENAHERMEEREFDRDRMPDRYHDEWFEKSVIDEDGFDKYLNNDDYEIITADSMEELVSKLKAYNESMGFGVSAEAGVSAGVSSGDSVGTSAGGVHMDFRA